MFRKKSRYKPSGARYDDLENHYRCIRNTLVQITPLQNIGAEMGPWGGGERGEEDGCAFTLGWAYTPNFTVYVLLNTYTVSQ